MRELADVRNSLDDFDGAVALLRKRVENTRRRYGDKSMDYVQSMWDLAGFIEKAVSDTERQLYWDRVQKPQLEEEILGLRRAAYSVCTVVKGGSDVSTMTVARLLARVCIPDEAAVLLRAVLGSCRGLYGDRSTKTVRAMIDLVKVLSTQRKFDDRWAFGNNVIFKSHEAAKLALEALEVRQLALGFMDAGTIEAVLLYHEATNFLTPHFFRSVGLALWLMHLLERGRPERSTLFSLVAISVMSVLVVLLVVCTTVGPIITVDAQFPFSLHKAEMCWPSNSASSVQTSNILSTMKKQSLFWLPRL